MQTGLPILQNIGHSGSVTRVMRRQHRPVIIKTIKKARLLWLERYPKAIPSVTRSVNQVRLHRHPAAGDRSVTLAPTLMAAGLSVENSIGAISPEATGKLLPHCMFYLQLWSCCCFCFEGPYKVAES